MNNVVKMVNYYIIHKNADYSVIEYLKGKIDKSSVEDLIVIQIELLFTDPSDKLVSTLVSYINEKINDILRDIKLVDLASLIGILNTKKSNLIEEIYDIEEENKKLFSKIKNKDFNNFRETNETDNECAGRLISMTQDNIFNINKKKSEINSLGIWLNNLDNSYIKKVNSEDIKELIICYIDELTLLNRDEFINKYIVMISRKIDELLLNNNILDTIVNIMPELDKIYKDNSEEKNEIYKLLDYYIDLINNHIKRKINKLEYEERLLLKDKIKLICKEILENDNEDDDFKVQVINSYLVYL